MPDTNGGRMLTAPETRLANRAAVSPADRMYTPVIMPTGHPEPLRRPVTARKRTPRPAKSWFGRGVLALASFTKRWPAFRDAVAEILSEGSQQ
jgi:hypothetical protein